MTDAEIIRLYFDRSERAIEETDRVYGRYCRNVSYEILRNSQDSEEIVNDTYLKTWNSIPPKDPPSLKNFLAKIVRGLSINRLEYNNAQKRGGGQLDAVLDELEGCIPSYDEKYEDGEQIRKVIDSFLRSLPQEKRRIFIRRYWYLDSIDKICRRYSISQSKAKSILFRCRNNLRKHLVKEGFTL